MSDPIPSEISLGWAYIPPTLVSVLAGFLLAYQILALIHFAGLNRYFPNTAVAFLALWVLNSSLVAIVFFPP